MPATLTVNESEGSVVYGIVFKVHIHIIYSMILYSIALYSIEMYCFEHVHVLHALYCILMSCTIYYVIEAVGSVDDVPSVNSHVRPTKCCHRADTELS